MAKIFTFIFVLLLPVFVFAGNGIIVNNQPVYAVPPGANKILVLDLTLPEKLTSIKISNLGTAQHSDISNVSIYEDGASAGWDGDELLRLSRYNSPFWGVEYASDFSKQRIFVTVDLATGISVDKTIQLQAVINSSATIIGLARTILPGASLPSVPVAPLIKSGQAISTSTIRWNFMDSSANEFGFKIRDASLKTVAEIEQSDVSYLDETGLAPDTCYSGRRVSAFNDRGESFPSFIFSEVCTLAASVIAEVPPTETPGVGEETPGVKEAEDLTVTIRLKIIETLKQIIQLLQQKFALLQANFFSSFNHFLKRKFLF